MQDEALTIRPLGLVSGGPLLYEMLTYPPSTYAGPGNCRKGRSENCLAKSFAFAMPHSQISRSVPLFITVTVIVMNSFGPASSAHIVTGRLLRLVAPCLPSFASVIFMAARLHVLSVRASFDAR